MNLLKASLWRLVGALTVVSTLLAVSCGTASTPTAVPTKAPSPTATTAATSVVPTPTITRTTPTAAATPTMAAPTTAPQPTATAAAVFGVFNVNPGKITGIEYPGPKPNFSTPPKKGGFLTHANALDWPHFDFIAAVTSGQLTVLAPVYSKLVDCKGTLELAQPEAFKCEVGPQLAQSWEVSPDGKTWTFHLRQGMKWQNLPPVNGREVTAADVKYSYDQFVKGGTNKGIFALVTKVEAVDKYTLGMTLGSTFAQFLAEVLASPSSYIVAHEIADRDGDFRRTAVGSGPFQIKQVFGKERLVYEKNPNYFIPGAPIMDGMSYLVINDRQAIRAAYRAGLIQKTGAQDVLSVAEMNSLAKSNPETVFEVVDNNYGLYDLVMRLDKAPFSDVRVRRAMSMAIDRPGIIKDILESNASILVPIPWNEIFDTKPTLDQLPYYRYDQAAAKQLLKDAGYPNGFKFKVNYYPYAEVARYIAPVLDNLKQVGIEGELVPMDTTSFNTAYRGRTFDQAVLGFVVSATSMDGYTYGSMNSKGDTNFAFINDPDIDRLTVAQRSELDPVKQKDIFRQIFAKEVDQVWRIPMPRVKRINYVSPKLHNYAFSVPTNQHQALAKNLEYVWVDPQ